MSILIESDYKAHIQKDNLDKIIGDDKTILAMAERFAESELTEHLAHRYDCTKAFKEITEHDDAKVYAVGDRVYAQKEDGTTGIFVCTAVTSAGIAIDDTDYWTEGDDRSPSLVMRMVDVVIFHIHRRINPRNIPELRQTMYADAIEWAREAGKGTITANLPTITPDQGYSIRWGSNEKQNHSY